MEDKRVAGADIQQIPDRLGQDKLAFGGHAGAGFAHGKMFLPSYPGYGKRPQARIPCDVVIARAFDIFHSTALAQLRMIRMSRLHTERHLIARIGWLRAAVLGANDGIVSTASLIVGVAAANASRGEILLAGVAGLVAGAMSMAAGEYVSVSSQSDAEQADLRRERAEIASDPEYETEELAGIYAKRGLGPALARQVAEQLMAKDALGAHARDELGISEFTIARPVQAALTSAITFAVGASLPLLVATFWPAGQLSPAVSATSLLFLALLGAISAKTGGAGMWRAALRVAFWGALAMALTAGIGALFGAVV